MAFRVEARRAAYLQVGVGAGAREVVDGVGVDGDNQLGGRAEHAAGSEARVVSRGYSSEGIRTEGKTKREPAKC